MMNILENKYAFTNLKPKKPIILIVLLLLSILIFILLFKIKVYDNYQTKGYVSCNNSCTIKAFIPTDINYKEIAVNNKKVNYQVMSSEIKVDEQNLISYLELSIKVEAKVKEEEIVNLNFYYQKQRLITKLRNFMF